MRKLCIMFTCLLAVLGAFADNNIFIQVQENNGFSSITETKKKRKFPKYKTENGLLKAYAGAWSKADYQLMYHLLAKGTREEWTFTKFKRLMLAGDAIHGGVAGFDSSKKLSGNKHKSSWQIVLEYKNESARGKTVRSTLVREGDYWFIKDGGLLPSDLSPFDR